MIRLTNISKNGNIMSATVTTVEETPVTFEIVYNVKTGEIIKNTLGMMNIHSGMAISKLINLSYLGSANIPKSTVSAYY